MITGGKGDPKTVSGVTGTGFAVSKGVSDKKLQAALDLIYTIQGPEGQKAVAESSSLVYATPEVRALLMAARAVDDPTDELAVVSTLRSSLFGCSDPDLFGWVQRGGPLSEPCRLRKQRVPGQPGLPATLFHAIGSRSVRPIITSGEARATRAERDRMLEATPSGFLSRLAAS